MTLGRFALLLTAALVLSGASLAQDNCNLDAALSISFEHGLYFLFNGNMMYKINVNYTGRSLQLNQSMRIGSNFTHWPENQRVTRTWAWRTGDHPTHFLAVIGNHQNSHYVRVLRSNGSIESADLPWPRDSMLNITTNRDPESRAFYYSLYQPGYVFSQLFTGNMPRWPNLTVRIRPVGHVQTFSNASISDVVSANNPSIPELFNRMSTALTPIGVFLTGNSDTNSQPVVVFVSHENRIKHCFGNIVSDNCSQPANYQDTNRTLFCPPPPPTTTTTTEPTTISTRTVSSSIRTEAIGVVVVTTTPTPPLGTAEAESGGGFSAWIIILIILAIILVAAGLAVWYFGLLNKQGGESSEVKTDKKDPEVGAEKQAEGEVGTEKKMDEKMGSVKEPKASFPEVEKTVRSGL